jgi:hypothetical protein
VAGKRPNVLWQGGVALAIRGFRRASGLSAGKPEKFIWQVYFSLPAIKQDSAFKWRHATSDEVGTGCISSSKIARFCRVCHPSNAGLQIQRWVGNPGCAGFFKMRPGQIFCMLQRQSRDDIHARYFGTG